MLKFAVFPSTLSSAHRLPAFQEGGETGAEMQVTAAFVAGCNPTPILGSGQSWGMLMFQYKMTASLQMQYRKA